MNIKALIKSNLDIQNVIDELNCESKICTYKLTKQSNLLDSPDLFIVIFEIAKYWSISGTYDLLKKALLEIVSKIFVKEKQKAQSTQTSVIVIVNDKRTEFNISFELSDEQKDKLVEAAVKKLFD